MIHQQLQFLQLRGQLTGEHIGGMAVDVNHHHQLDSEGLLIDCL